MPHSFGNIVSKHDCQLDKIRPRYRYWNYLLLTAFLISGAAVLTGCGSDEPAGTEPPTTPEITNISPNRGPVGITVTLGGSGFSAIPSDNMVTFNGIEAVVNVATPTNLEVVVPDSATTGPVAVTVSGELAEGPVFTVENQMPGIASIEPDSGLVGTEVTIRGMNFSETPAENTITFNGTEAPVTGASDSLLVTEVPDGAGTGPVEVTVDGDTATGPVFTVITWGEIEVFVSTSGSDQDPDGYTAVLDGGTETLSTAADDTVYFEEVEEGTHDLELTDISGNCSVAGNNPRSVNIAAGDTTSTSFGITCTQTTGTLEAIVSTSGSDLDPDGYTLTLDGSDSRPSAIDDTLYFEDLGEGIHDIELTGAAGNCTVSGSNPRTENITAGNTTTTVFDVFCNTLIQNQIVFHSDRDGNQEIYVMDADGSNQMNLTNNAASDFHPAVSPDGTQVVFGSDRDGNEDLYIMNADGSGATQLTTTTGVSNSQPAWSPDGSQIAFARFTGAQQFDIFVINTDGTGETNITNHSANDSQPDWSPDGSQIVFTSTRDGEAEIFVMNEDGSSVMQLTNNAYNDLSPAWSPDGSQIAFSNESLQSANIFIMDADGSNQTGLTNNFSTNDLPDWSPDGTQVVYHSDQSGDYEIYVIDTDGSGNTNLSNQAGVGDEHPTWE